MRKHRLKKYINLNRIMEICNIIHMIEETSSNEKPYLQRRLQSAPQVKIHAFFETSIFENDVAKINDGESTVYCYTSLSVCLVAINALYSCTFSGIAESLAYRDEVAVLKADAMGDTLGFGI